MWQTVGMALLGVALGGGCGRPEPAVLVPVIEVKQQTFARIVEADGYLRPIRSTPVVVPSDVPWSMRLNWLAPNGSVVKKGDPVARFDDLEPRTRLADAEARRAVTTAYKQKEAVIQGLDNQDRLRNIESMQRSLHLAQSFQHRDPMIFSRAQIIENEVDERLQAARLEHAQKSEQVGRRLSRNKIGIREVDAQKSEESIRRAEKGMRALQLVAPDDGVLTIKRRGWSGTGETLRVGDTVYRSATVAEVARVDDIEVEVFVLEAEAAELVKGRKAEVLIEAQPGRTFAAEVKQVETVTKRLQEESPTQYFGVTLTLGHTESAVMKPGERVRARLFLHEQQALVVPRPALIDRDGHWVVYRRAAGGGFSAVPVTLGASTAGLVTIENGLHAGDVIALRDPGKAAAELLSGASATPAAPR